MPDPNKVTVSQLLRQIGTPDCPALIDVCIDEDFADDPFLIPGSFRHPHTKLDDLIPRYGDRPIVVICQQGKKLSQGAAAYLRSAGFDARYLEGGVFAWREDNNAVRIKATALHEKTPANTKWVIENRPSLEQLFCLWLIKRFVDRDATILFVSLSEVPMVAEKFGAEIVPSSAALQAELGLETLAIDQMKSFFGSTLKALIAGQKNQHRSDEKLLGAALPVFDALYLAGQSKVAE